MDCEREMISLCEGFPSKNCISSCRNISHSLYYIGNRNWISSRFSHEYSSHGSWDIEFSVCCFSRRIPQTSLERRTHGETISILTTGFTYFWILHYTWFRLSREYSLSSESLSSWCREYISHRNHPFDFFTPFSSFCCEYLRDDVVESTFLRSFLVPLYPDISHRLPSCEFRAPFLQ